MSRGVAAESGMIRRAGQNVNPYNLRGNIMMVDFALSAQVAKRVSKGQNSFHSLLPCAPSAWRSACDPAGFATGGGFRAVGTALATATGLRTGA